MASAGPDAKPQIQPCRYKTGKTLGAGSYSVVKECVHIDTGRYYAAKVINKRMMHGREHMVWIWTEKALYGSGFIECGADGDTTGAERDSGTQKGIYGSPKYIDPGGLLRDHEQLYVVPHDPVCVQRQLTLIPANSVSSH